MRFLLGPIPKRFRDVAGPTVGTVEKHRVGVTVEGRLGNEVTIPVEDGLTFFIVTGHEAVGRGEIARGRGHACFIPFSLASTALLLYYTCYPATLLHCTIGNSVRADRVKSGGGEPLQRWAGPTSPPQYLVRVAR